MGIRPTKITTAQVISNWLLTQMCSVGYQLLTDFLVFGHLLLVVHSDHNVVNIRWDITAAHKYKLLCPRGTQTCALAVANIKVNGNTARR